MSEYLLKIYKTLIENLDEAESLINFSNINEEDAEIGDPPWIGKDVINYLICLTFDTHKQWNIEQIHNVLEFLAVQSTYEDVKWFLIKYNFLYIAKFILENQPTHEIVMHILRITSKLCYNNEMIDTIGKFKGFVGAILHYLNCSKRRILRKIIRFLRLVMCEIQINSKSDWIVRLKECKFFGRRIIFILESSKYRTGVSLELIQLLRSISEISLPDQTNFLEQLFDIDKLICALLISYTYIIPRLNGFCSTKEYNFIENWLLSLTLQKIHIGVDEYIIDNLYFNAGKIVSKNMLGNLKKSYLFLLNLEHLKQSENIKLFKRNINTMYRIVKMLWRFPYIPKTYGGTIDYLNGIFLKTIVLIDKGELRLRKTELDLQNLKKLLNQYWLRIVAQRTCQHIGYILKSLISNDAVENDEAVKYLINLVRSDCNVTPEIRKKMEEAIIVFNQIRN